MGEERGAIRSRHSTHEKISRYDSNRMSRHHQRIISRIVALFGASILVRIAASTSIQTETRDQRAGHHCTVQGAQIPLGEASLSEKHPTTSNKLPRHKQRRGSGYLECGTLEEELLGVHYFREQGHDGLAEIPHTLRKWCPKL